MIDLVSLSPTFGHVFNIFQIPKSYAFNGILIGKFEISVFIVDVFNFNR